MITIQRTISTPHYTEGKLLINGFWAADTLELPWRNNQTDVSCIPSATTRYRVVKRPFGKFYEAYKRRWGHDGSLWIRHVNGRTVILLHTGVSVQDTLGCPLVGEKLADGRLWKSRDTYKDVWEQLDHYWKDYEDTGIPLEVLPAVAVESEAEFSMQERLAIEAVDL